jgi:hypothetical protein
LKFHEIELVALLPQAMVCLAESRRDMTMPNSPQRLPFTTPKRPYFIGPGDAIALRELYEELPYAAMRAAAALRTDGTILRGDDLLDFSRAEDAVTEIIRRINEILENLHTKRP